MCAFGGPGEQIEKEIQLKGFAPLVVGRTNLKENAALTWIFVKG